MSRFFERYSLYELVTAAVMAALGIAIKPIVVPLAHIVCGPLMIPSGALAGGLYMMWLVIGYGIIGKPGSAFLISLIEALLVVFTGVIGSHGVMSLLTYVLPGIAVEAVMIISGHRGCCTGCCAAAGILSNVAGTASVNIIFFRAPGAYLIFILSLSAISGLLGGLLSWELIKIFRKFSESREKKNVSHRWMDDIDEEMKKVRECFEPADDSRAEKKKHGKRWIAVAAAVLFITAGAAGWINHVNNEDEGAALYVLSDGETAASFSMNEIMNMKSETVDADLSSSGGEDAEGEFRGVLLSTLLEEAGADVKGHKAVLLTSGDGYSSAADTDELSEVMIAYENNGETLGYYSKGGTGPLRALFFKDTYGNRSVMNVKKVDIK